MGLIATVKRWIGMIFKNRAEKDFDVKDITSPAMEAVISRCADIYRGVPAWVSAEDNIKTINFAKAVCSETARLATLAIRYRLAAVQGQRGCKSKLTRCISSCGIGWNMAVRMVRLSSNLMTVALICLRRLTSL